MNYPKLTIGLGLLSLRRYFTCVCVSHRLYNGQYSEDLFDMMPTAIT